MSAFFDATCEKCKKRIGWCGKATDRPACSRCGHRPDRVELEAADAKMDEFRKLVASRPGSETCYKQRVAAGLAIGQAARMLGVTAKELADMEHDCGKWRFAFVPHVGYDYPMKTNHEITVAEAAKIIGVDPSQVRRYIRDGILPARAVTDRLYLVPEDAARKFVRPTPGPRPSARQPTRKRRAK